MSEVRDRVLIRPAVEADAAEILAMIRELAAFERAPDAVVATEADLRRDGWGPAPQFAALMAERKGAAIGFALYCRNYSTWEGRAGIHLEDLYVRPAARGSGTGRRLIEALARITLDCGGRRLDLSVLDWNPAREVYAALGFRPLSEWRSYRLTGKALAALADGTERTSTESAGVPAARPATTSW
jgi:GNAT superfamily N-acetyltransferase